MRNGSIGLMAASLLVLAACGQGSTDDAADAAEDTAVAEEANASADEAASGDGQSAGSAIEAAGGATLSREYLVGRWSEEEDCQDVVEFRADGSFVFPWGDTGQWELDGDRLTMSSNTDDLRVAAIDRDNMRVTYGRGRVANNKRC